jgi:small subunit ribosomal protein S6e
LPGGGIDPRSKQKGENMQVVLSDPKTGVAYSKKTEKPEFLGKKIGEEVSLEKIGLTDYKGKISGGTDKDGIPMHPALTGTGRRKILLSKGIGFRKARKGEKRKRTMHGNTITQNIVQLNIVLTQKGDPKLLEALQPKGKKEKTQKEIQKEETEKTREKKEKPTENKEEEKSEKKEE